MALKLAAAKALTSHDAGVRIRAVSVFEGVVYHCWCADASNPSRPTLEVEAILRPGDADALSGPLLLPVADFIIMAGGPEIARPALAVLDAKGRIVTHLDVAHIRFPTWTTVADPTPPGMVVGSSVEPGDDQGPN